jgi:hypothetical protein
MATVDRARVAGYVIHLEPIDAFWGARYAIIDDPDGNHIGIMSPSDGPHETTTVAIATVSESK